MKQQEINYFLDGVETKQGLIESIEGLRNELRKAMAPLLVPVMKEPNVVWDDAEMKTGSIFEAFDLIYESDLNQYEKAVILYMTCNTDPKSIKEIADACSISTSSVKRVISKHMMSGDIMRAPFEPGYILTKYNNK